MPTAAGRPAGACGGTLELQLAERPPARAIPDVRIADYATTHNPAFVTSDGRSTFALVYTAPVSGFGGSNLGPAIDRAVTAAAPASWHVGSHRLRPAG